MWCSTILTILFLSNTFITSCEEHDEKLSNEDSCIELTDHLKDLYNEQIKSNKENNQNIDSNQV